MDTIKKIKSLAHQGLTRREISNETGIKYSTLTTYIRKFNIKVSKPNAVFGKGRPLFAFDKQPRKRRSPKPLVVPRTKDSLTPNDLTEGGGIKTDLNLSENKIHSFDIDKFLDQIYETVNKPITLENVSKYE